ncbi:hypothetical protein KRP22_001245 [Phytophthora ramorum]|uniref:uncharacterized protein n=1 Tax=Phytophthora ramorum TaxID=164328 RepID=UPI0030ACCFD6|nr:hypothetical protein KRP23_8003 [Phytophthora ramorum]KAH7508502.1 hypothetical protein KRP22_18 [Phytophthora ramorum]
MVEYSPGLAPEDGAASPPVNLADTSPGAQRPGEQPPQHRSNASIHPILFKNAADSDGNVAVSVSPLPGSFCGAKGFAEGKSNKPDQKREVVITNMLDKQQGNGDRIAANESDTFLNASMQLMHLNGEARQRVRQLWTSIQRLGRENQISETGMDLLYAELGNILKSMNAEKLEATKFLKSGRLVLLASSPAVDPGTLGSGAAVKALFGARPAAQLLQCSLSEDQSKLEMVPVRQENAPVRDIGGSTPPTAPAPAASRFGLPTTASLIGMISDAFQEEPATRIIKLQGCQVRRLVPKSPSNDMNTALEDDSSTRRSKLFHRFQLLVPYKTQMSFPKDGLHADVLSPTRAPTPYESFIFEVTSPLSGAGVADWKSEDDADEEVSDWVSCLDRVCRFQLHRLEHALREAPTIDRYRETLQRHFPVCVSVSWLRNRVDQQTLQRRASVNLSMIQIVKDLGRDKVLLDDHLFSAGDPYESDDMESDSVSQVVKYMVKRILEFEQETCAQHKAPGKTGSTAASLRQPSSPAHRFATNCEARALAFVERVLQGSSRTQSGGDIYDAISFFCQQEHVSICPVSQDARPVQMRLITDAPKGIFQVEVLVCMQFKVIELTPRSATPASSTEDEASSFVSNSAVPSSPRRDSLREWAVLEGTLSRQFTLGQLAAPGTVTINYIS